MKYFTKLVFRDCASKCIPHVPNVQMTGPTNMNFTVTSIHQIFPNSPCSHPWLYTIEIVSSGWLVEVGLYDDPTGKCGVIKPCW